MSKGLVSIIVPVYNAEKYLRKNIESVVAQTYKNFELILVNDGSVDSSLEICEEFANVDKRICVIDKMNGGVSSARNEGLKKAKGEFVTFIDSDDYIGQNYLTNLIDNIDEQTDLVVSGYTSFDEAGMTQKFSVSEKQHLDVANINDYMKLVNSGLFDSIWNKLYKRDYITDMFTEGLPLGEDRIFNLNYFSKIKNVTVLDSADYFYLIFAESLSHKKRKRLYDILIKSISEMSKFLDSKYGTHAHDVFYKMILDFAIYVVARCEKFEKKDTFEKVKNDSLVNECLKNFKPELKRDKIKIFLLKNRMFGLARFVSNIKN